MAKQMIADLKPGGPVDAVFLVANTSLKTTRANSTYLDLRLTDRSGTIAAKLWDAPEALAGSIATDDFVRVKGKVETYRNELQINVRTLTRADTEGLRLGDFLPQSERDPGEMMKELREILDQIVDPDFKALVNAFLDDEEFCGAFRTAPAAKQNHHAYLGGLLEHTLSMAHVALKILEHYTELRRDLLLTAVFFHDVGKTREIAHKRTFQFTTPGSLIGHIVLGASMVEERARGLPDFPEDKLNMILHTILSHHGELAFGAPKLPMFVEAQVLHYLDNLDAKIKDFADVIAEDRSGKAEWTDYSRLLGRSLYKG